MRRYASCGKNATFRSGLSHAALTSTSATWGRSSEANEPGQKILQRSATKPLAEKAAFRRLSAVAHMASASSANSWASPIAASDQGELVGARNIAQALDLERCRSRAQFAHEVGPAT